MLLGHDTAWAQWRGAISGRRMHHGWILAGQKGMGKMTFARAAARELVAEAGTDQPAPEQHPDIHVLTHLPANEKEEKKRGDGKPYERKRNISVGQIRAMQRRLHTRPTLGSRRVIIIDPADDMENGASNALLKSLEEPPAGTFFLLVTHRPAQMLATIRSRCRILRFPKIAAGELAEWLRKQKPELDDASIESAVLGSGGAPGAALQYITPELQRLAAIMSQIAQSGDGDFTLRGQMAAVIGARPDRGRLQATVDLGRRLLANRLQTAALADISNITQGHTAMIELGGQIATYNFDPGLLVTQIGNLLAQAAPPNGRDDA